MQSLPHTFSCRSNSWTYFFWWWIHHNCLASSRISSDCSCDASCAWARGLLVSKMLDTAKGMVQNLLTFTRMHGFMANGARTYYENRRLENHLTQVFCRAFRLITSCMHLLGPLDMVKLWKFDLVLTHSHTTGL